MASPSRALDRLGLAPRRRFSQVFLRDSSICGRMVEAAELGADDDVLEIGPGLGVLTRALAGHARRVVAVELDRDLAAHLSSELGPGNIEIIQQDALRFDPAIRFDGSYKLVANLPYSISSPALTRYLVEVRRPSLSVVMLQREVAERLVAPLGQASFLTILAQLVCETRLVCRVPASAFYPRPRVESAVVWLRPHPSPLVEDHRLPAVLQLVRAGFAQPRKTVANSLMQGLAASRDRVTAALTQAGLDPGQRPQVLSVADWLRLFSGGLLAA